MKPNHKIEGIVIIGWLLLAIGILLDDITTWILLASDFGVLETNPIYQMLQSGLWYAVISVCLYILIGICFYIIVNLQRKLHKLKFKRNKIYDLLVFAYCFMIVFLVVVKIGLGVNNLTLMTQHMLADDGDSKLNQLKEEFSEMQTEKPLLYQETTSEAYTEAAKVSYFQMLFIIIGAYLLFRTGYRVVPSDL